MDIIFFRIFFKNYDPNADVKIFFLPFRFGIGFCIKSKKAKLFLQKRTFINKL